MSRPLDPQLERYADLAIQTGLGLQPGQRLIITAPIEAAAFVRIITERAYRNGARFVDVIWSDDQLQPIRFRHAPGDSFEEFPTWQTDGLLQSAQRGDARLAIHARDPELLKGQDPERVAIAQRTQQKHSRAASEYATKSKINWCVIAMPVAAWANKVFAHLPEKDRVDRLWDAIFQACRLDQEDPVAAWHDHTEHLRSRGEALTEKQYRSLRFSAPGTDLTVGLPEGHIWRGGQETTDSGILFTPNLPTEEVFTLPHRNAVDGVVASAKPLNYSGTLIQDFSLVFEGGKVIGVQAKEGRELLQSLVDTDDGAARLGEVALVPHSSPISGLGLLFYNTLFDENAACHVALGRSYRVCMQDGENLSDEAFCARGGNDSAVHVDFMVGSEEMDVDGIAHGGSVEPIMRSGEWTG